MTKNYLVTVLLLSFASFGAAADDPSAQTRKLVGQNRGLIAHVGCGEGTLTAALHVDDACLVHGIDRDPAKIAKAREHIRSLNHYGPVSVEVWDRPFLPYVDNSVNVLIIEDAGNVTDAEILRVVTPGGKVWRKKDGKWTRTEKPRNNDTDEWTHYRHDASGNPVAHDALVGPPQHLQWTAGPGYTRNHEFTPSLTSLVSSGGRIFYVADEGPIRTIREPSAWHLVARDAYNGLQLWKRPLPDWFAHLIIWTRGPRQLNRKLVADGDRLYVTLGYHAPLTALDAATGETLLEYPGTKGAEEIICDDGMLAVVVREVTDDRADAYHNLLELSNKPDTPLAMRDTSQPLIENFRDVENKTDCSIVAFDASSGDEKWRLTAEKTGKLEPLTLCAYDGVVFYQRGGRPADKRRGLATSEVVALDLKTGEEIWSVPHGSLRMVCESGVVCLNKEKVQLLSRRDGAVIWSQPTALTSIRDVFVANDAVWIGGFKPFDTGRKWTGPVWGPYFALERDLDTGEVRREIGTGNPGHHQRCYDSVATDRYILSGRRGTEFTDLDSGDVLYHSWARGTCRYGVMPANGLLYAPPHECGCYVVAKLIGFNALAASRDYDSSNSSGERLEKGPAFGRTNGSISKDDWPTFRHDAARSGTTSTAVPDSLTTDWQVSLGKTFGKTLTAPTIADGRVFVASKDRHEVLALDLATGDEMWRFTTDGPVDSPPTIHGGRVLFGCRDGWVYALRASDGALAWRFQAARDPRRLVADGRLESPLPVPGSVLVMNGEVWFTAGRSSYMDGGIDLFRLDAGTGKVLSRTRIYSPDPDSGAQSDPLENKVIRGSRMDVLTADDGRVFLQDRAFTLEGELLEERRRHLFAATGFLDDSWVHRSYWIYGENPLMKLGSGGDPVREIVFGRLLLVAGDVVYGYGRKNVHWSNEFEDGKYRFFARDKNVRKEEFLWEQPSPVRARALIVAGDTFFAAGLPNGADDGPARLVSLSKTNGKPLADVPLETEPVLNGMAAAGGKLVLTLENGEVVCLGGDEK